MRKIKDSIMSLEAVKQGKPAKEQGETYSMKWRGKYLDAPLRRYHEGMPKQVSNYLQDVMEGWRKGCA